MRMRWLSVVLLAGCGLVPRERTCNAPPTSVQGSVADYHADAGDSGARLEPVRACSGAGIADGGAIGVRGPGPAPFVLGSATDGGCMAPPDAGSCTTIVLGAFLDDVHGALVDAGLRPLGVGVTACPEPPVSAPAGMIQFDDWREADPAVRIVGERQAAWGASGRVDVVLAGIPVACPD